MKKLLTTMSAVALAMGLYANAPEPAPLSGTSFEGLAAGAYDIKQGGTSAAGGELGTFVDGTTTYWETNSTATLEVVNEESSVGTRPEAFDSYNQYNYLSIKTTLGNPVSRFIDSDHSQSVAIGDGLYFDSLVKFTAFDDDPLVVTNNEKLAIWLKEVYDNGDSADPTATNLMITAGYLNADGSATVSNYTCSVDSSVHLNDGGWHRVTVKMLNTMFNGVTAPGFVVFIDEKPAKSSATKFVVPSGASLTDNAKAFNDDGALFPSALSIDASGATAIKAVDFDGQGCVDDIVFTTKAPNFAKDYEYFTVALGANVMSAVLDITVDDGAHYASTTLTATDETGISTNLVYAEGVGVRFGAITYAAGYMASATNSTANVTYQNDTFFPGTGEQSVTLTAKAAGAYVGDTPYGTLAEAIDVANAADSDCTLKLAADATAGVRFSNPNSGVTITLDLAGNEIAAATTDPAAILVEGGAVSIIDSVGGGKVTAAEVETDVLGHAVVADGGTVTITAGTYDGDIIDASITGGGFLVSYKGNTVNTKAALDGMIVGNYEAKINPGTNYYVLVEPLPVVAEHPWYDSANNGGPVAIVFAENLPSQDTSIVSAFHGQGSGSYLGLTYTTGPKQFDLFGVDGTNALTTIHSVAKADLPQLPVPGLRGVAISEALGVAMTLSYYGTNTMYTFPLTPLVGGNGQKAVSKPDTHAFDAAAFSPEGNYLFSNAIVGESSNQFYVKWSVSVDDNTGALALTKVGSISAGGRGRNLAYANINGRDLVFGLVDTGKVVVMDMTGDDTSAWTATDLITGLPAHSYGSLCVSGVNVVDSQGNPATPHLTVATSTNNGTTKVDVLNVYALTVPASGAVSASLVRSFDEDAMARAGFGDISDAQRYGNTVYVTDDEATIYFARPDCKLYAAQYGPYYDVTFTYGLDHSSSIINRYAYGVTPTAPNVAIAVPGYNVAWPTFSPVTDDVTYAAQYSLVTYTITYKDNEGNAFTAEDWAENYTAPTTFTVAAPATLPVAANIARDGVQFNGWTNSVGTTIAATTAGIYEDLEIFADFTVLGPTYPSYIDTSDSTIKGQYDTWAEANNVPAGANDYEAAFLLNVAPAAADQTLDVTAIAISGTTVTITLDHSGLNGYVYVYEATTVAGLASATPVQVTESAGVITRTSSDSAKFYKIVVSANPVVIQQ